MPYWPGYIFFINIPIGLLAFLIIYFFAQKEVAKNNKAFQLNKLSSFLLGLALFAIGIFIITLLSKTASIIYATVIALILSWLAIYKLMSRDL